MAKKIRNGLTQKQRKTQNKRVAEAIDGYMIRPNRPMRTNWRNYPDPAESPVEDTETRQTDGGGIDDATRLGLVTVSPLAGEGGAASVVCHYCGETYGNHTGQCPTVSFGGAS